MQRGELHAGHGVIFRKQGCVYTGGSMDEPEPDQIHEIEEYESLKYCL